MLDGHKPSLNRKVLVDIQPQPIKVTVECPRQNARLPRYVVG
jgi:hypothetical protein